MAISPPKIVNVVTSSWVGEIDIKKVCAKLPKTIYEPGTFPGLIYKRRAPDCTVIMFASGRMVSTGVKTIQGTKPSIYATVTEIEKITGNVHKVKSLKIENIVATQNLGLPINLSKLCSLLPHTEYDSRQFAGLVHRWKDNGCVMVFSTGKLVFMGAKSQTKLCRMASEIRHKISLLDVEQG